MAFDKRKALQSALTYSQQGKWDKAIAEYQAILRADSHDLTVCNNLGDLYARVGKADEAIEQYLKLGELYRADGLSVKAIAVYKKIIKLEPSRSQALLACADLYEEQGLTGEAKIQLATVAEHYTKAGDIPKVIEVYQRLAALDQTNHVLLKKLADLLLKEGKRQEAAAQYELAAQAAEAAGQATESKRLLAKACELTPALPQESLASAEQLLHEGRHAEAVDAFLRVTAGDHTNAQAWHLLGEAYIGLGQAPEAITALEQSVGLGLPEEQVRRPLAKALVLEGRTEEGIALCQKLTQDAVARSRPDEAIAVCREIVALAPNLAPIHAHLVRLLQDLGRDEESRAATWALAAAHEACGEAEEAIHVYHLLLERDPSDAEAKARLEVLEGPPALEASPAAEAERLVLEELTPAKLAPAEKALEEPVPTELAPAELAPAELAPTELALGELVQAEPATAEPAPAEPVPTELAAAEPVPAEPAPAGLAPEELLALELPLDDALTLGDSTAIDLGEGLGGEARPAQVFELDETGELAGIPFQESHGAALEDPAGLEGPGIAFPGERPGQDVSALESLGEEEEVSGEVAELLAEAEVYLKYGLTEKARERLLEVTRHAPDNLTAHRQLKALYLERPQAEGASGEFEAIARILMGRGQVEAAQRELQEGLKLAPENVVLQRMLAKISGASRPAKAAPVAETAPAQMPEDLGVEIQEPLQIPDNLVAQGEVARDFEVGPVSSEDIGVAETAPFEVASAFELADLGREATPLEEELPAELRSLLQEPGEEPALIVERDEASVDQAMADDLAEAEFYISQGMLQEARTVHQRMRERDEQHPAVARLGKRIEPFTAVGAPDPAAPGPEEAASFAGLMDETAPRLQEELPPYALDFLPETLPEFVPPVEPRGADARAVGPPASAGPEEPGGEAARPILEPMAQPPAAPQTPPTQPSTPDMLSPRFSVMHVRGEAGADGFVNLGAELEEELAAEDLTASAGTGTPLVEDLLREFQKGVREHLDEKDFETHYNLGIAYKEMELYEEAIQEFRLTAGDPARVLGCAGLLGLCYLAKGDPAAAIREFKAGLEVRGHPRESYFGLRYDLGVAYETSGDLDHALEAFKALQADDERFRDVSARVQNLRERLQPPQVVTLPASPAPTGEPAKRAKGRKKKISFI